MKYLAFYFLTFFFVVQSFNITIAQEKSASKAVVDISTSQYQIKNLAFNSTFSDFGLFPYNSSNFFFSSNRENENTVNAKASLNYNNLPFLDIYVIVKNSDTSFSAPFALPGNKETRFNEGPIFFDAVSNSFFITRNQFDKSRRQQSRKGVNRLKLYIENIEGSSFKNFGEFEYNSNLYSVGHAALTPDGKKIFFSSDMPGGMGGPDLYVCTKDGDNWSKPRNLGNAINTSGNEMFPFVSADGKLYFSSNGHSTQSGLDIFSAEIKGDDFINVKVLGQPFNSDQDDFSFYIYPDNKSGYFSSDRAGGKGDDDIYSFALSNPILKGVVYDEKGIALLPFVKIKIMDDDLNVTELVTDSLGTFEYEAAPKTDYIITAHISGYVQAKKTANTSGKSRVDLVFNLIKEDYGIEGSVLNKDNRSGIQGAIITLIEKKTKKIITTISDSKGHFNLNVEKDKEYTLRIEKSKFMTSNSDISTKDMKIGVVKKEVLMDELVVGKSIKIENVYYDVAKWNIRADAKIELDKMVELMNENPGMEVELSAHTDSQGSNASNLKLSDSRAKAVAAYIISKGITASRVTGRGYGENKLLNNCSNGVKCSEAEHQINRRTEFTILKLQ